ncbi:sugar ABC transporter ATP-binding protein [Nocardioides daeguensis]|nr:sugar ABC transporter ATP-binding protein [Nocardioides daeguensis]MBV6727204.1 sugar ABC transporter ATP-binding protein [Nocardioides daeguensis]MCR1771218.1 sugar ABC transporter ATP-binding protein [Nocardioides daeguensis]
MREPAGGADHVVARSVHKRFAGVAALRAVDVVVRRATIHALVGENGAGKSTLGRLIAGVHAADGGVLEVDGRPVRYSSPREALVDGITILAQELTLVEQRSVIENVFLGVEERTGAVLRRREMRARYRQLSEEAGFTVDADAEVATLRLADKQKVEILRALARRARLIVMDEPTAALTTEEAQQLLAIMRDLRSRGTTIIFVSHFLEDVLAVADDITVLRDGALVRSGPATGETVDSLVTAMLGRPTDTAFPRKQPAAADAPVRLSVQGLRRAGSFSDISFEVRSGEILGIAGLVGAGRTEVARGIFGADRLDAGRIVVDGVARRIRRPRDAVRAGIAMLPESRKDQGLLMDTTVLGNVTLAHLGEVSNRSIIDRRRERRRALDVLTEVGVDTAKARVAVTTLSGGNQQKTLFAKWLLKRPAVLIADEPTRGVDVGSKRVIYDLLLSLAADGMSVVVISSELEEVLGLAHRVLVMREGRIVSEHVGSSLNQEAVLHAAFASTEGAAAS